MKIITINLQNGLELMKTYQYNRSEEIRFSLRTFFDNELDKLAEIMGDTNDLKICTINIPKRLKEILNDLIKRRFFPSRSEAIRFIVLYELLKGKKPEVMIDIEEIDPNLIKLDDGTIFKIVERLE